MNTLLPYLLESSLCLVLFFGAWWLLFRREQCFEFSRFYLLGASLLSLLLPLLHISTNSGIVLPDSSTLVAELPGITVSSQETATGGTGLSLWNILFYVYISGLSFGLIRLAYRLFLLSKLQQQQGSIVEYREGIRIVRLSEQFPPFSFFRTLWMGTPGMDPVQEEQIIRHEQAHIRQLHSLDLIWFEVLKAIFWFNPVVYTLRQQIEMLHEYIADRFASEKSNPTDYADLLARQALQNMQPGLVHAFHKAPIIKRLQMIHKPIKHTPMMKYLLTIPVLALAVILVSCEQESASPVAEQPASTTSTPDNSAEEVHTIVEEQPTPVDGMESYFAALADEMQYPEAAKEEGAEGRVFIQFVVNKNGVTEQHKVIKGFREDCDEEALRVVKSLDMPWNPGMQKGERVNVRLVLPVSFKLDD